MLNVRATFHATIKHVVTIKVYIQVVPTSFCGSNKIMDYFSIHSDMPFTQPYRTYTTLLIFYLPSNGNLLILSKSEFDHNVVKRCFGIFTDKGLVYFRG